MRVVAWNVKRRINRNYANMQFMQNTIHAKNANSVITEIIVYMNMWLETKYKVQSNLDRPYFNVITMHNCICQITDAVQ